MRLLVRAAVALVVTAGFAGTAGVADQGKSGDSTDWGCGGHLATAASLRSGEGTASRTARFATQSSWHNWWFLNRPTLLAELSYRVAGPAPPAQVPEKWRDDVRAELREQLESSVVPLASEAALALGRGGDPRDAEVLGKIAASDRRQQNLRRRAALALGLLPVEDDQASALRTRDRLFGVLQEAVGNNDDRLELWGFAVYSLGLRGDMAALPRLRDFVHRQRRRRDAEDLGTHREVMGAAVATLGLFREPLLVPDLADMLHDDKGSVSLRQRKEMIGWFAAQALARIGDRSALPALCRAASDERVDVRRGALLALGAVAGPADADAIAVLVEALATDSDDPARGVAAVSLGRTAADAAPDALTSAYQSGSSEVRSYAALGLGLFARKTADADVQRFLLEELAGSHDTYEMGALCIANGLAVNLPSAARLTDIAREEGEPTLRARAAFALGLLGMEGVPPQVLLELVRSGDGFLRHEAALAPGLARRRDGVDALIGLVDSDESLPVRRSAAVALGRIAGAEAAPVLLKVLRDDHEVNALRICAAHGLGLLLDRSEGRKLGLLAADVNWVNEINRVFLPTEVLDQLLLIMD